MNPLIHQAEQLRDSNGWQPQGLMPVKRVIFDGEWKGHTAILWLQFYSAKELGQAIEWAKRNGYTPMGHDTFTGSDPQMQKIVSGEIPLCPVHGTPMRPSKKPGSWFCPKRVAGGYCDAKL